MGNSSNKKELCVAIDKILIKTLITLPKNDLNNPGLIATKIYFEKLHQNILIENEKDKRDVKTLQMVFKHLENFANFVYENQENDQSFMIENDRLKEQVNNIIRKMNSINYSVLFNGVMVENIEQIASEIKKRQFFEYMPSPNSNLKISIPHLNYLLNALAILTFVQNFRILKILVLISFFFFQNFLRSPEFITLFPKAEKNKINHSIIIGSLIVNFAIHMMMML